MASTLRTHAESGDLFDQLSYWALHQSKVEVDFLLRRERAFLAIETKASRRYHTAMLSGLPAIAELPGMAHRILVYGGDRSFRSSDGIDIWPAVRFATEVAAGTLWP